jgi:L-lactate utilization protein LutC
MTPRDAFLARVRQAVAQGNQAGAVPPLPERGTVGYQGAGSDAVACFREAFSAAGGFFHAVPDAGSAILRVLDIAQTRSAHRVLLGGNPFLDTLPLHSALTAAGLEVRRAGEASREETFAADLGISSVDYLIAETGSLALATRPDQPRSLSLLPPLHIVVAHPGQIVPDLFDLLTPTRWPAGLPTSLTLITGPSKTGDIELRLVTGVHGPGEVHVVLLARSTG